MQQRLSVTAGNLVSERRDAARAWDCIFGAESSADFRSSTWPSTSDGPYIQNKRASNLHFQFTTVRLQNELSFQPHGVQHSRYRIGNSSTIRERAANSPCDLQHLNRPKILRIEWNKLWSAVANQFAPNCAPRVALCPLGNEFVAPFCPDTEHPYTDLS